MPVILARAVRQEEETKGTEIEGRSQSSHVCIQYESVHKRFHLKNPIVVHTLANWQDTKLTQTK